LVCALPPLQGKEVGERIDLKEKGKGGEKGGGIQQSRRKVERVEHTRGKEKLLCFQKFYIHCNRKEARGRDKDASLDEAEGGGGKILTLF